MSPSSALLRSQDGSPGGAAHKAVRKPFSDPLGSRLQSHGVRESALPGARRRGGSLGALNSANIMIVRFAGWRVAGAHSVKTHKRSDRDSLAAGFRAGPWLARRTRAFARLSWLCERLSEGSTYGFLKALRKAPPLGDRSPDNRTNWTRFPTLRAQPQVIGFVALPRFFAGPLKDSIPGKARLEHLAVDTRIAEAPTVLRAG